MRRTLLIARAVAAAGAAGALAVGLAACSTSVPKSDVESTIKAEVDKQGGTPIGPVTCPGDLKAAVGEKIRCSTAADGQPIDVVATVTSLEGSTARFDILPEARPVAKALLQDKVGEQVGQQARIAIESTDCGGDLQPHNGATQTCTVRAQGENHPVTVTVTDVQGGLINFSIQAT